MNTCNCSQLPGSCPRIDCPIHGLKSGLEHIVIVGNCKLEAPTAKKVAVEAIQQLEAVKSAVRAYHAALNRREHGGVAQGQCVKAIEAALGLRWEAGVGTIERVPAVVQ
jgi:hypothetical protein